MRLAAHLRELRNRFYIAAAAIVALAIVGFLVSDWIIDVLQQPLELLREQGRDVQLNITFITQAFDMKMRIGFVFGLVAASPVWLYQLVAFFMPGLHKSERKYVIGFLASSVPLFIGGCVTGWFVLPRIITIFVAIAPTQVSSYLGAQDYFDFAVKLLLAVGIGFVMPVLIVFLNFAGVVRGTSILGAWRWAIIGVTLFSAFVTPAGELLSMFILAAPILVLYFTAAGIAILNDRRRDKKQEALLASDAL